MGTKETARERWAPLRALVWPHRGHLLGISVTGFLGGLAEAAFLVMVTRMALAVADGRSTTGLLAGWTLSLGQAVAVAALLVALRLGLALLGASLSTGLTATVRGTMRSRLSAAYLRASWATHEAEPSGRLAQLMTAFTNESMSAVSSLAAAITAALSLTALVLASLLVDPMATLAVVVALAGLAALLAPVRRRIQLRSRTAANTQMEVSSAVSELGTLGLEMQTYGARVPFEERIGQLVERDQRARRRADMLRAALPAIYTSLAYGALLGGLALAGVAGTGELASMGAVMLVMLRSLTYGQQLQVTTGTMLSSLPYAERFERTVASYLAAPASGGSEVPDALGTVQVDSVSFAYVADRPVLDDVSFSIAPGETVGIIGPSGAGKSTLVQLLLGVRDPSEGAVRVDGHDLRRVDRGWWSHRVAFVAQEAHLFTGTVADNIRFFREDLDDAAVRRAAALAHVDGEIEALPDGYEAHLGERGAQLSGGQRQRVSIARALAGEPELLILDEPTSALDVNSEALIRRTITELHGRSTIVIIAHRLSTLEMCDRLLVIEGGRLVAAGTPEELRQDSEFYRHALELSGLK